MHPTRKLALAALLVVTLTACGGLSRRGAETPPTPEPVSVGAGLEDLLREEEEIASQEIASQGGDGPGEAPTGGPDTGSFELVVVDHNGGHPAGIPVEIGGTLEMTLTSDAAGRVVIQGPAGHYTFKVPVRCMDDLQVQAGGTGRFGIAAGQSGSGQAQVQWHTRYAPWPPVHSSVGPWWPVGETVDIRYEVIDRCEDEGRAPDRPLSGFTWQMANLEMVGQPRMHSDGNGYGHVRVRCIGEGEVDLSLVDGRNPTDVFDLIENHAGHGQRPSCRRS